MTRDADLKRVIRDRMATTGETYTAAREAVLAAAPPTADPREPVAAAGPPTGPAAAPDTKPAAAPDPFYDKTIRAFFDGDRLRSVPTRRKPRAVVLIELAHRFAVGHEYAEPEVNAILRAAHDDYAYLRRELVDYRYLERTDGVYRRTTTPAACDASMRQEVPADEAARLGWA